MFEYDARDLLSTQTDKGSGSDTSQRPMAVRWRTVQVKGRRNRGNTSQHQTLFAEPVSLARGKPIGIGNLRDDLRGQHQDRVRPPDF
jgi:hypothetical protein